MRPFSPPRVALFLWLACVLGMPPLSAGSPPQEHAGPVQAAAFSPDGQWLATASLDGTVLLRDVQTERVRHCLRGHAGGATCLAFSPDGSCLLVGENGTRSGGKLGRAGRTVLRLWDVETGQERSRFHGHRGPVTGVAFSPTGAFLLSAGADGTLRLWDGPSARELRRTDLPDGHAACLAFCPDGKRAATGGADHVIRLWDVWTCKELRTFRGHTGPIRTLTVSPDGRRLLSGTSFSLGYVNLKGRLPDNSVRLWDVDLGRELQTFPSRATGAFLPDGRVLLGGGWHDLRVWDGKPEAAGPLPRPRQPVRAVAVSPDGRRTVVIDGKLNRPPVRPVPAPDE